MKKIIAVFLVIAAVLSSGVGVLAYKNHSMKKEITDLKEQLEEALNKKDTSKSEFTDDTDDAAEKGKIEDILYRYVDTLTHCGGDLKYGQTPAVADFLTDKAIMESLTEYSPYTVYTDEDIKKVRELNETNKRIENAFTFDSERYVKLSGDKARAVIIYEGTFSNGYIDTIASYVGGVLEFDMIKNEDGSWLIDETVKELLF